MKTKYLNSKQKEKGQTVIETALMIIFLFVLIFGITELARAWWLKNQLNNAARVGVRVAIVTPSLTLVTANCSWGTACTTSSANPAVIQACASITNQNLCAGAGSSPSPASVTVERTDDVTPIGTVSSGDTIRVSVQGEFVSVVPGLASLSFGLFPGELTMNTNASMRYE